MEPTKKILFSAPTIRRNNYRWYIEYYVVAPGGAKIRKRITCAMGRAGSDEEKERIAAEALKKFQPTEYIPHGHNSVGPVKLPVIIDRFFQANRQFWEQTTFTTYRSKMRVFTLWLQKNNYTAQRVSPDVATQFMVYLLRDRKSSRTTYNAYRSTLVELYHHHAATRKRNPFNDIRAFPDSKEPMKAFSDQQKITLIEHIQQKHAALHLFIGFMYYTFLRPREIVSLSMEHIDFSNRLIKIPVMVGKTKRWRVHSIPAIFFDQVKSMREMPANYFVFGSQGVPGLKPVGQTRYYNAFAAVLQHFHYNKGFSLYSWRHNGAIDLYRQYEDVYLVKNAMQHAHVSTTEGYLRRLGVLQDKRLQERKAIGEKQ